MKNKELSSMSTMDLVKEAIELVKILEKKEKHIAQNNSKETISDEQINTKYTSGFCGTLAQQIKTVIDITCSQNYMPNPKLQMVKFDLPCGFHMYLKIPNPNPTESDPFLYADISGIYTLQQVHERNKSDVFVKANNSVNLGETPRWVMDRNRDDKIFEQFSWIFLKRFNATSPNENGK